MLVFLMRQRAGVTATMNEPRKEVIREKRVDSIVDAAMEFVDFSD
jgi:hypothetical protein